MAAVEEEIDAVLFELNGIRLRFRDFLDHADVADVNFVTARSAQFGLNFAGDNNAGLLRETFEVLEGLRLLFERDYTLNDAGAVAKNREEELAGLAEVVEPAANFHALACELAGLFDGDGGRGAGSRPLGLVSHSSAC